MHLSNRSSKAFTLVELLVVIAIIGLLIALLVPTFGMINETLVRTQCAGNLNKCHKVLQEYAAKYAAMLPGFSGSNPMEVIEEPGDITVPVPGPGNPHLMIEELKKCGASPDIFFCPASPDYGSGNSHWKNWDNKNYARDKKKTARTPGYVFFIRTGPNPGPGGSYKDRYYASFIDRRPFAKLISDDPKLPLGADMLRFDSQPWGSSRFYKGWHHKKDNSLDEPGGGGHTLFLSGAVQWVDWNEFEDEMEQEPPLQPYWNGASSWRWYYFARRYPR